MIAADTSTWIAFLEGDAGEDAELLDKALADRQVVMVPVVLTELLSDPEAPYRGCRNALSSSFDRDRIWLLATSGRVAS